MQDMLVCRVLKSRQCGIKHMQSLMLISTAQAVPIWPPTEITSGQMCCPAWDSDCDSVLDSNTMHANELNNEQPHLVQTMPAQPGLGLRSVHCATNFQLQQQRQQQLEHYGPSGSVKVSVSQQECTLTPLKGCARMSDQRRRQWKR